MAWVDHSYSCVSILGCVAILLMHFCISILGCVVNLCIASSQPAGCHAGSLVDYTLRNANAAPSVLLVSVLLLV